MVQDSTQHSFTVLLGMQQQEKGMFELLTSHADAKLAVEFAAACGALTTQNPGAIAGQPKLEEVQELVKQRQGSTKPEE